MSSMRRTTATEATPIEANGTEADPLAIARAEVSDLVDRIEAAEERQKQFVSESGKAIRSLKNQHLDASKRLRAMEKNPMPLFEQPESES